MTRRVHYIKLNHTSESPQSCIWFDTETRPDPEVKNHIVHQLVFGWAAYSYRRAGGAWVAPRWFRFTTKEQFWAWVETCQRPKVKCYMFCHNTGFDIPVLDGIRQLALAGWTLDLAVIDAPPTILKYHKGGRIKNDDALEGEKLERRSQSTTRQSIVILDTLNIYRMPLKKIGEIVGLEKYDMPPDWDNEALSDKYCRRDVEIIMEGCKHWFEFLRSNDLGGFAQTLASQAMRSYRHRFMNHNILIDDNEKATSTSREAYYGGRTECFRLGHITERLYLLDVNSMYPAVMADHEYPHKLIGHDKRCTIRQLAAYLEHYTVCARVTLNTSQPIYPLRKDDRLVFPTGVFTTFLSSPELSHAIAEGHLVKVHECSVYRKAPLFKEFVEYFYTSRQDAVRRGDKTASQLFKIMMNSLYGKFGQRGIVWESHHNTEDLSAKTWEDYDLETGDTIKYRQLGGLVQTQMQERESRESFPAIAAHVTAHARMLLWSLIAKAGRTNVYYCDTDSLLVNACGFKRLSHNMDETRLGFLKLEGTYDDAEIRGNKDYRFGDKERTKGVRKNAVWKDKNTVQQEQWSSLKGLLARGDMSRPTTKPITKVLKRVYMKGEVLPSGYIRPFKLTAG